MLWIKLALALVKLADLFANMAREKELIGAGEDRALAEASASILLKTKAAKEVMQRVTAMSEDEVDKALKELEP